MGTIKVGQRQESKYVYENGVGVTTPSAPSAVSDGQESTSPSVVSDVVETSDVVSLSEIRELPESEQLPLLLENGYVEEAAALSEHLAGAAVAVESPVDAGVKKPKKPNKGRKSDDRRK